MVSLKQSDVAAAAGISTTAYNAIERGTSDPRASNLAAIQRALEAAGVDFIPENGGGPGARLMKGFPQRIVVSIDDVRFDLKRDPVAEVTLDVRLDKSTLERLDSAADFESTFRRNLRKIVIAALAQPHKRLTAGHLKLRFEDLR